MKKRIIFVFIIIFSLFLTCGCGKNPTVLSVDDFKKVIEDNSYKVNDVSEDFKDDEKIDNVIIGYNDYMQLEFYTFKEVKFAKDMFESNKQSFQELKENTSSEESKSNDNYAMYSLITGDEYMYIERRDNTIIYLRTPVANYNDARDLLLKLQ